MTTRLAMFPLGTVLPPFGVLPLHVFEPRYRALVADCLGGTREFGVVLIERGSEVGGDDQRFAVATVARIAEAVELPDGRWFVVAVGTHRVDVARWLADDPYPVAECARRADEQWSDAAAAAFPVAEQAVRRTLALAAEVGEDVTSALIELADDPIVASWQLVAVTPLGSLDKQRLLGLDDPATRLRELAAMAEEQAILLATHLERE